MTNKPKAAAPTPLTDEQLDTVAGGGLISVVKTTTSFAPASAAALPGSAEPVPEPAPEPTPPVEKPGWPDMAPG